MLENEILKQAFAMPLTSPAYPPGPYRFVNREYLIITYRCPRLRAAPSRRIGRMSRLAPICVSLLPLNCCSGAARCPLIIQGRNRWADFRKAHRVTRMAARARNSATLACEALLEAHPFTEH